MFCLFTHGLLLISGVSSSFHTQYGCFHRNKTKPHCFRHVGYLMLGLSTELLQKSQRLYQLRAGNQYCQRSLRVSGYGFSVLSRKHPYGVYQLWCTFLWTCIPSWTFHNWEKWAEQLMLLLAQRQSETDWTGCAESHARQWCTLPRVPVLQLQGSWASHSSTCPQATTDNHRPRHSVPVPPSQCNPCFWGAQDVALWVEEHSGDHGDLGGGA